jgi:hypothetical protein
MKVTVILKDFTEAFYQGHGESIVGLLNVNDAAKFEACLRLAGEKRITMKIGTGQFRDAVELNAMRRNPCTIEFKLEPRKGYKLATFEFSKVQP